MAIPTTDKILKAIKGSGGVMSTIAKKLNVEWHTAKSYVNSSEETKTAYQNENEAILDMADGALYRAVKQGEGWAIKWLQATRGKERGYVEKTEVINKNINYNSVEMPPEEIKGISDVLESKV